MGLILYKLIIKFYFLVVSVSALFNEKASKFIKGRKDIFLKLEEGVNKKKGKYVWFHCASLGEFEQGRPLIEAFKVKFPRYKILLTFFSPSGYEIRKNYAAADLIYYLPLDSHENATKFLNIVQPELAVFIKYEFWHFFIEELHRRKIPLLSVSSVFRKEQLFFKFYGGFYRAILKKFNHFFVQDDISIQLLKSVNITKATKAGDTRFDRVSEIAKNVKRYEELEKFIGNKTVFLGGSLWPEDMKILSGLASEYPKLKFIIAPHEIGEGMIQEAIGYFPDSCRYSHKIDQTKQVLIIDNIGMLSSLYQYATYAFIGGAYGKGLHNVLEAATFGMPMFFGNKNYKKFVEAVKLVDLGGAFPVESYEELKRFFIDFEENQSARESVGKISREYVTEYSGATEIVIAYCANLLKER